MEDALLAQLQNTSLEEHDDKDRIEAETDSEVEEVEEEERHVEHSVSLLCVSLVVHPQKKPTFDFTFIEIIFTARRRGKSKGTSNGSQRGKGRSYLSAAE